MTTSRPDPPANHAPDTRAGLEALGFAGFLGVGQLHADHSSVVPDSRGVYLVVRDASRPPEFAARSFAPVYRGEDPSRPVAELAERWVPGAHMLYVGLAPGPGVRSLLRQRIKRYLRFGHGRVVGHWAGRLVWQLADRSTLRVAWRVTESDDPAEFAAAMLAEFQARHGRMPFANLPDEPEDDAPDPSATP